MHFALHQPGVTSLNAAYWGHRLITWTYAIFRMRAIRAAWWAFRPVPCTASRGKAVGKAHDQGDKQLVFM